MVTPNFAYQSPKIPEQRIGTIGRLSIVRRSTEQWKVDQDTGLSTFEGAVTIDGATARYTISSADPNPELKDTAPVFVIPGHFGYKKGYQPLADQIALQGTPSINFGPPRHQGVQSLSKSNLVHPHRLLPVVAMTIARKIKQVHGIEGIHLLGHSLGAPAAVYYTKRSQRLTDPSGPEVQSLTLLDADGSTKHNLVSLTARGVLLSREFMKVALKDPTAIKDAAVYGGINLPRTLTETIFGSNFQLRPDQLRRISASGVATMLINHEQDNLFPARNVPDDLKDSVDDFHVGKPYHGGHVATHLYPAEVAADLKDSRQRAGF